MGTGILEVEATPSAETVPDEEHTSSEPFAPAADARLHAEIVVLRRGNEAIEAALRVLLEGLERRSSRSDSAR